MRKLSVVFISILLLSCEGEEGNSLNGKWNLIDVTCECAPTDFEMGDHQWAFNLIENEVTVLNVVEGDLQILETGTYDFKIKRKKITILDVEYDYYFEDKFLFLADEPESDGPLMKFVRDN